MAEEGEDASAEEAPAAAEVRLGRREVVGIIGGLALAMFLGALNQTIVATALPTIGRAFGDFENLSWVVIAYLLTSTPWLLRSTASSATFTAGAG
jgi:hypothetical protein